MPRSGLCTNNAATNEYALQNELLLRDVADRVIHGDTFASIGRELGLDRRTVAKIARQARDLVNDETRAELAVAQIREFATLNAILRRLEPFVAWDYEKEARREP